MSNLATCRSEPLELSLGNGVGHMGLRASPPDGGWTGAVRHQLHPVCHWLKVAGGCSFLAESFALFQKELLGVEMQVLAVGSHPCPRAHSETGVEGKG